AYIEDLATPIIKGLRTRLELAEPKRLRSSNPKLIYRREREILATYIGIQSCRTAQDRQTTLQFLETFGRLQANVLLYNSGMELRPEELTVEISDEHVRVEHCRQTLQHGFMAGQILQRFIWIFDVNTSPFDLVTSDVPVIRIGHVDSSPFPSDGFASPGVEIDLPISSRLVLRMFQRRHWKALSPWD